MPSRFPMFSLCIILPVALLTGCGDGSTSARVPVTFVVTADSLPSGELISLAGSSPDLGPWEPDAVHLKAGPDGAWTATLDLPHGEWFEYKFTRGTWWTEGVGVDGIEMPNFSLLIEGDTTVHHHIPMWRDMSAGPVVISLERFANKGGTIELYDRWKYHAGDSLVWASPDYDDSPWRTVPSLIQASDPFLPGWSGRGWFRLHMRVDSTLRHRPLALSVSQTGASEVYLNGRLIAQLGTVGTSDSDERPFESRIPRIVLLDDEENQLLAVRYSDFSADRIRQLGQATGFAFFLGDADAAIQSHVSSTRIYSTLMTGLMALALILAVLHFLLFVFNRTERGNLYFSFLMAAMAVLAYADLGPFFASTRMEAISLSRLSAIGAIFLTAASLGAVYTIDRGRLPVQFYVYAVMATGLIIWLFARPGPTWNTAFAIVVGISALELLRVVTSGFVRDSRTDGQSGQRTWMIGAGGILFVVGVLYQLAANLELLPLFFSGFPPFYIGFVLFAVSISLHLAYRSGAVNKELKAQLEHIRTLSARTLEQERRAREEELSRRLLEADNARKTQELEEARRVQLAMLPADVPHVPGLSIAVRMKTATEVGGDYYDFREDNDGSLTIAIGDATGHGTKAGIMVTLIKSLFNVSGHSFYIPDFFQHCTTAIRRMNLEGLYMALQIARIKGRKLTVSTAGMPPFYVFRAASGTVEEVKLKGMPLGAYAGFPYQQTSVDLHAGDTVLFLSDGFPERFNRESEILGYGRIEDVFGECGTGEPGAVIDHMIATSERWGSGTPLNDDMTFVVVKIE